MRTILTRTIKISILSIMITTACAYANQASLKMGPATRTLEKPEGFLEKLNYNIFALFTVTLRRDAIFIYPLSNSQRNLKYLFDSALGSENPRISLIQSISGNGYNARGISLATNPNSIEDLCGDDCQKQILANYDFIGLHQPLKDIKPKTTLFVFENNLWDEVQGSGFLGAANVSFYCKCMDRDGVNDDLLAVVLGEGENAHRARLNALEKCSMRKDGDLLSGTEFYIECERGGIHRYTP